MDVPVLRGVPVKENAAVGLPVGEDSATPSPLSDRSSSDIEVTMKVQMVSALVLILLISLARFLLIT